LDWSKTDWCSLWSTGHYPVPRLETSVNWSLSGFLSAHPLKIIGLSGVPPDCPVRQRSNGQLRPMVDCADYRAVYNTKVRSQSAKSKHTGLSVCHRTVRCCKRTKDFNGQQLQTQRTWHSPDSEWCSVRCTTGLSSVPIDSNGWNSGWGYKYPQPPPFKPSKHCNFLIQY
jgi:hypothetical protein